MFGGGHVARKLGAVGESDDSVLDEGCAKYLRESLLTLLMLGGETEGVKELEATHQWSGIWGTSKDHFPWVGEVPGRRSVWVAGGYSGMEYLSFFYLSSGFDDRIQDTACLTPPCAVKLLWR